jgi:hypothetical protein
MEAEDHLDFFIHSHGHSVPQSAREKAYPWLDRFLKLHN